MVGVHDREVGEGPRTGPRDRVVGGHVDAVHQPACVDYVRAYRRTGQSTPMGGRRPTVAGAVLSPVAKRARRAQPSRARGRAVERGFGEPDPVEARHPRANHADFKTTPSSSFTRLSRPSLSMMRDSGHNHHSARPVSEIVSVLKAPAAAASTPVGRRVPSSVRTSSSRPTPVCDGPRIAGPAVVAMLSSRASERRLACLRGTTETAVRPTRRLTKKVPPYGSGSARLLCSRSARSAGLAIITEAAST